MNVSKLTPGDTNQVNVFVESVKGSKDFYEYDENSDNFILKETLDLPFPGAYGFIAKTHHIDAKPLDVLVLMSGQAQQGVVLPARPIGVIRLKGDMLPDDVLITVAASDKSMNHICNINDIDLEEVKKFLESFKKSKVEFVFNVAHAKKSIDAAIQLYKKEYE